MNPGLLFSGQEFIFRVGCALMHSLWQSVLAGFILFILFKLLAGANAKSRYLLGLAGLILLFLLPVINFLNYQQDNEALATTGLSLSDFPALSLSQQNQEVIQEAGGFDLIQSAENTIAQIAPAMFWFWFLGLLAMLVYNFGGLYLNRRFIKRYGFAAPDIWIQRLNIMADRMNLSKSVQLKVSERILVPFTKGFLKPLIILPLALLSQLPADQLELVIAHELAHIKRHDYLINLFQILVESLLFFNPVVWWLSAVIRKEREHATDDLVLQYENGQVKLAKALANLMTFNTHQELTNNVVYFNKYSNMKRIERLLKNQNRKINFREKVMVTLTLFGLFLIVGTGGSIADPAQSLMKLPNDVISPENTFANSNKLNEQDFQLWSEITDDTIPVGQHNDSIILKEERIATMAFIVNEGSDS
ncbi:MAG TPA: M56 family metallopeptidase, partial [Bacteroidales bacterium]|nr:M56 family metallopeptidase [Bacteroidales bacterium]